MDLVEDEARLSLEELNKIDVEAKPGEELEFKAKRRISAQVCYCLPERLKPIFESNRKKIYRQHIGSAIIHPDATFLNILKKAAATFQALDSNEHKMERDVILSIFGSELTRQATMNIFKTSAWTIQRLMTKTKNATNLPEYIQNWKQRVRIIKTIDKNGNVAVHSTTRAKARICKSTGRTIEEERKIALDFWNKPEMAGKENAVVWRAYKQEMTGLDTQYINYF